MQNWPPNPIRSKPEAMHAWQTPPAARGEVGKEDILALCSGWPLNAAEEGVHWT